MAASVSSSANSPAFSITIDDTSPALTYSPPADASGSSNLSVGWLPFYTATGASPDPSTGEGDGTSLHVTSAGGASLSLRWNGACTLHTCQRTPVSCRGVSREPETFPHLKGGTRRAWRGCPNPVCAGTVSAARAAPHGVPSHGAF